ncbi:uncharacterized protein K444DRAFT_659880 [Hyaloscypha bicolor E]|uniref:Ubiquitin 3 binding protein But2 C-terminal domain-containing protein n=1 Tax=Hyaloscypha bicolor E TaxID=1095630 RepID=A0A2J6TRU2_9HELO|nr:uncharacterized protein K444DRAFT_659880 [Hyaloscypha bicolor E]PMD65733.1 hypothetical protein K444DRAFT_659880 [Hyaloscypha bicolor E]
MPPFAPFLSLLIAFIGTTSADIFMANASLPDSWVDGQPINAAGQAFWVGGSPSTYCPSIVGANCPDATAQTIIIAGFSALDVEVPGGQQIYVNVNGALGFTQAHSAVVPTGAYIGGFFNLTYMSDCSTPRTVINWKSPDGSSEGILACPTKPSGPNVTVSYQLYAKTPAFNLTNCDGGVPVDGLTATYLSSPAPYGAWQYV